MSTEIIVWVLTALGLVVVILTRVRLGKDETTGPMKVNRTALNVHTAAGALGMVLWLVFIFSPDDAATHEPVVGLVALTLLWVTAIAGLALLLRWLPSRGRHATNVEEDEWSEGPGLSMLAHFGMFVGVCVFTWAFATAVV